jgi:F0F1-type ATP synthase membrane subunit b/b'
MPQFDFYSFFSQIFWSTLTSVIVYLVLILFVVKNSSETIKTRSKLADFIKLAKSNTGSSHIYDVATKFFDKFKKN